MTNTFLYNNIENPLNNDRVIKEIIEAYASPSFSNALLKTNSSSSEVISNQAEVDKLYAKLFNTWKHSILTLKPEQIKTAIARGIYDKSIYKLYDLLKKIPDATTMKDVNKVFTKDYKDSELVKAISQYRWDSNSTFSETMINARSVYAKKIPSLNPEHELYINSANYDLHKFANIFIDKCTEMDLPYHFKISEHNNCDNKITIYSDSKSLRQYIDVLSKIEKEYPEIIKRCGEPPIISGHITNWLGYGRAKVSNTGKLEYLPTRIRVLEKSLDEELRNWYKENKDQISIKDKNGKAISLVQYLSLQICRDEVAKMIKCLPKSDFEKQFNMENYGYTEEVLTSSQFRKKLYTSITSKMTKIIDEYSNGRPLSTDITISFANGKTHTISKTRIIDEIKKSIKMVSSVDNSFTEKVKARIIENSKQEGIDSSNYCFNQKPTKPKSTNKKDIVLTQLLNIKKLASQYGCQYPRELKENETVEQYSMYLKLYCTKILKPVMDSKNQETSPVPQKEESKQTKSPEKIQKGYKYVAMTQEEISSAQAKLGFEIPDIKSEEPKENKEQNKASNNSVHYVYIPMTDEEIAFSRQKIGEYILPKQKTK